MKKKESILKRADEIINNRSEEKERQYGPTVLLVKVWKEQQR